MDDVDVVARDVIGPVMRLVEKAKVLLTPKE
jgi:hypothetical protein